MKRTLAIVVLLTAWAAWPGWSPAGLPDAGCRGCHPRMASPMPPAGRGAPVSCVACHQGDGRATAIKAGHAGMTANPSALDQAERACGPCHAGRAARVKRSPMATAVGIINQTRFLWGAQDTPAPRYGVRAQAGLRAIPRPAASGRLVDDLLRRRCLRCHLWTKGADTNGARRSAGCAACHRPAGPTGRPPAGHGLTRRVPVRQCLTCHAGCGAGAEYVGRIPRDAHYSARFLAADRQRPKLWQARSWRPMQPDLHHRAGLACIDCHPAGEIMGDGQLRPAALTHVGLRCTTCHGRPGRPPAGPQAVTTHGERLAHVQRDQRGGWQLTTKLGGRVLPIPRLAAGPDAPVAHRAPGHQRLACHACHSASNPAVWGRQAMRLTSGDLRPWRAIAAQGDPQLLELLRTPTARPAARDWLSGDTRPGLWLLTTFFRRYQWRVYGRSPDGRVMLLAPRFGWLLTRPGAPARARVTRTTGQRPGLGISPWHPHTTRKATVSCRGCHGGALEAGLGLTFQAQPGPKAAPPLAPLLWRPQDEGLSPDLDWTRVVNLKGQARQVFLVPGSRPFNAAELQRLLYGGKKYTRWLLRALERQWPRSKDPHTHHGENHPRQ